MKSVKLLGEAMPQICYEGFSEKWTAVIKEAISEDVEAVKEMAIRAKEKLKSDNVAIILLVEMVNHAEGKRAAKQIFTRILTTGKDLLTCLDCQLTRHGKPVPNILKRELAEAVHRVGLNNASHVSLDRGKTTWKDYFSLIHPKSYTEEQNQVWTKLSHAAPDVRNALPKMNDNQSAEEVWGEWISKDEIPYEERVKLFPQILNDLPELKHQAITDIRNPEYVANSSVHPIEYLRLYNEIKKDYLVYGDLPMAALREAMNESITNMTKLEGKTFVAVDVSDSMKRNLHSESDITYLDVAALMAVTANGYCERSITSVFATEMKLMNFSLRNSMISNLEVVKSTNVGWESNARKVIEHLIKNKIPMDRIILMSDSQLMNSGKSSDGESATIQTLIHQYRMEVNPNVWVHSFALDAEFSKIKKEKKISMLSGWNENIYEVIREIELV